MPCTIIHIRDTTMNKLEASFPHEAYIQQKKKTMNSDCYEEK